MPLKPEYEEEYIQIHANVWPSVLSALARHNIADYSIHYHKPLQLLIAHFKYIGSDYEKDMAGIASDPETQRWWTVTDQMQESFQDGASGSGASGSGGSVPWWTDVPEVFRFDGAT
ncbi:rhamnose mutarotase [Irpex lacteus]|nr:rhamnose mutarotase [Irpex lacteus]